MVAQIKAAYSSLPSGPQEFTYVSHAKCCLPLQHQLKVCETTIYLHQVQVG